MIEWPTSTNIEQLRGFLGLTRYYRKFVQNYAVIAHPLTKLLKRNQFKWSSVAQVTFENLNARMTQTHVLCLPIFKRNSW